MEVLRDKPPEFRKLAEAGMGENAMRCLLLCHYSRQYRKTHSSFSILQRLVLDIPSTSAAFDLLPPTSSSTFSA